MSGVVGADEASFDLVLEALAAGQGMKHRPGLLLVKDPELVQFLSSALAGTGVEAVEATDDAPLRAMLKDMAKSMAASEPPPDATDTPGVTAERMRSFAEAAAELYRAAPWRYLNDADLVTVESPPAPMADLRHFTVMGSGGQQFGLSFFKTPEQHERLMAGEMRGGSLGKDHTIWSVLFGPIHELPFGDADLFEDEALPVANENAYPLAWGIQTAKTRVIRPDAKSLAFMEAMLRAMAATSEEEIDRGRWSKRVQTADGEVEVTLALPELLEDLTQKPGTGTKEDLPRRDPRRLMERMMADIARKVEERGFTSQEEVNEYLKKEITGKTIQPRQPTTPQEQAEELVDEATATRGRRRVQLARRALELWPDCADAYILLAERGGDANQRIDLYHKAMRAAERSLGSEKFRAAEGRFWGVTETRPYMRARAGLALALERAGRKDEAVKHYDAMLKLNPGDNQGLRYSLAPLLYELGRYDDLQKLLDQYKEEDSPFLLFMRALLAFRREGDSPAARSALAEAVKGNNRVRKYLLGDAELPFGPLQPYGPGSDEEAVMVATEQMDAWRHTPAALDWLRAAGTARGPRGKAKRKR